MFTRTELEVKSLRALRDLCRSARSDTRSDGNTDTRAVSIAQGDDGGEKTRVPSTVQPRETVWTVSG